MRTATAMTSAAAASIVSTKMRTITTTPSLSRSPRLPLRVSPCAYDAPGERLEREQLRLERDAEVGEAVGELRTDTRALQATEEPTVFVDAHAVVEQVKVLHDDGVALHAEHLGHVGDAPRAVAQAREVHDAVERARHLLTDGSDRQLDTAHQHHRLDTGQRVARAVRVDGGERAVVAGVHGLQHVERFGATRLTDENAVRTHTQRVAHEVANFDLAGALDVRRARFHRANVVLPELELLGV